MKDTGTRIKSRRIQLGYSVDDLANITGLNRATLYRYENGEIKNASVATINKIANALNMRPQQLTGLETTESEQPAAPAGDELAIKGDELELVLWLRGLPPEMRDLYMSLRSIPTEKALWTLQALRTLAPLYPGQDSLDHQ